MPASNRRGLSRQKVTIDASLIDNATGLLLGKLVNVHSEGLMILSHNGVDIDNIYQATLTITGPHADIGDVELGVDCMWKRELEQEHGCWAGFKIIAISDTSQQRIDQLVSLLDDGPTTNAP